MLFERLSTYEHIIWDWNGTLLSDVEAVWEANRRILARRRLSVPTLAEYRMHFSFPVRAFYERLGFDLVAHPFEALNQEFMVEYMQLVQEVKLFEGTEQLLARLAAAGKTMAVLSAAEEAHLEEILRSYGLREYFAYVYGQRDHHGHSKMERGRELLAATSFERTRTILVGDTDHDLEVGRELGVQVLLIADGHQDYARLADLHDNVLASRFLPAGA